MRNLSESEVKFVSGGGAWDTVKAVAKKITPVALAISFVQGVIDGIKSEMPQEGDQ